MGQAKTLLRRSVVALLIVSTSALNAPVRAELIPADATPQRARVVSVLDREDVRAQLAAHGVSQAEARARVEAMSDQEIALLAERMDELPAGAAGDPFSAAAFVVAVIILVPVVLIVGAVALVVGLISSARKNASQ